MIRKVFIDFDGTLVDCRKRLYLLFMELSHESKLTDKDYWELKQRGLRQSSILKQYYHLTDLEIEEFAKNWLHQIEQKKWLTFDTKRNNSDRLLQFIKESGKEVILVTNRQLREHLLWQLKRYEWDSLFDQILVTEQQHSKSELICKKIENNDSCIFIGDTIEDISTAKENGINSIAVYSGIEAWDKIKSCEPTYAAIDLNEVIEYLRKMWI